MKTEDKVPIGIALILVMVMVAVMGYTQGHKFGYRDASYAIPLYHEVTGVFPDQEWVDRAVGRTLTDRHDIIDMLYPFGEFDIADEQPNELQR